VLGFNALATANITAAIGARLETSVLRQNNNYSTTFEIPPNLTTFAQKNRT